MLVGFSGVALADESGSEESKTLFTEKMALQWASDFASNMGYDGLAPKEAIKFYGEAGQGLGYIISYYQEDRPHGYVVFDATENSLISQFSFEDGVLSPYESALKSAESPVVSTFSADSDLKAYKTGSFTYCFALGDQGSAITEKGEEVEVPHEIRPLAVDSNNWTDIFVPVAGNYANYSFGDMNTIPQFYSYPQAIVMQNAGRYACGVSAMTCCIAYYDAPPADYGVEYLNLWIASGTSIIGHSNGIPLGNTQFANLGPAVVKSLAEKGVYVSYQNSDPANMTTFKQAINRLDMGLFGCGISLDGEREGHIMAVGGYATVVNKTTGAGFNCLLVADGWYGGAAYLNFDYAKYTDTFGVTFKK